MLLESSWVTLGGSWTLLGASWAALGASWAPGGFLERPWRLLGALLESSWGCLAGVLEASEGSLDAPESILEASGSCLLYYVKNMLLFIVFSMIVEVSGACGTPFGGQNRSKEHVLGAYHGHKKALGGILRAVGGSCPQDNSSEEPP